METAASTHTKVGVSAESLFRSKVSLIHSEKQRQVETERAEQESLLNALQPIDLAVGEVVKAGLCAGLTVCHGPRIERVDGSMLARMVLFVGDATWHPIKCKRVEVVAHRPPAAADGFACLSVVLSPSGAPSSTQVRAGFRSDRPDCCLDFLFELLARCADNPDAYVKQVWVAMASKEGAGQTWDD